MALTGQRVHSTLVTAHIPLLPAPGLPASGPEALLSEREPLAACLAVIVSAHLTLTMLFEKIGRSLPVAEMNTNISSN